MVGEIFVGIITVVFWILVWAAAFAAPIVGGMFLFDYLNIERRFGNKYGHSRVGQLSPLIKTAFWIAVVLYYALYLAIIIAVFGTPAGDVG